MPNIEFTAEQKPCDYTSLGCDRIQFLISTNPGEPPKPLAKIASGGELSRIMLAIKTVLAGNDRIGTLIFDEIDTGISGKTSRRIGAKLKKLSQASVAQVLCVTHLPQIASMADCQYFIEKTTDGFTTSTNVRKLDREGMIGEISRLSGADGVSVNARRAAEELKNWSDEYKAGL